MGVLYSSLIDPALAKTANISRQSLAKLFTRMEENGLIKNIKLQNPSRGTYKYMLNPNIMYNHRKNKVK